MMWSGAFAHAGNYLWDTPQATVLPQGDLEWAPEPFTYTPGASVRYIDFENGDDNNSGTSTTAAWKHHPWDANATGNARSASGILTYVFKRGVIYRGQLIPDDSGAAGNPIRLTSDPAWGDGTAWLYGSEIVTNWQQGPTGVNADIPSPNQVWYADLPFAPRCIWMVDATGAVTRIPLARQPNWTITDPTDPLGNCWRWDSGSTTNIGGGILLGIDSMLNNPNPNYYVGGLVWSEWGNLMSDPYAARIEAYDPARKAIAFSSPWGGTGYQLIVNHRYWLEDKPHYLDQAGEFWFNKSGNGGRLYLRLPSDIDPSSVTVEAARHVALIYKFRGTLNHVDISGLGFRFGNVYWPLEYRDFQDYPSVCSAAIHVEGSGVGIAVRNCIFEHVSQAVRFRAYPANDRMDDLLVADNDIRYNDHCAIQILNNGGASGPVGLARVLRNRIRDIGLRPYRVYGHHTIQINYAQRQEIAGNILERVGGAGIFVFGGKATGEGHDVPFARILIFNNKVKDALLCGNDWGGIENWQGGPFYIYNNISRNTVARQNYRPGRFGGHFYLDGAFKSYHFNNIAWGERAWALNKYVEAPHGFLQVLGYHNTFFNNAVFNCGPASYQQSASTGRSKYLGIVTDNTRTYVFGHAATTSTANYDTLAYDWNVASRVNNSFGIFEFQGPSYATLNAFASGLDNRKAMAWATGIQPPATSFTDPENGDFRLVTNSPGIDFAGKVFVPWSLYAVEGEWNFNLNRNTPAIVYDEAWYMRQAFVNRDTYQYLPTMPLTCVNTTTGSFVASPLETWAPGALRLDGVSQYAYSPGSGPNRMSLDIITNSFLIELYFRSVPGHTGGVLVAKKSATGYTLDIDSVGFARFTLHQDGNEIYSRSSSIIINDGAWHHLLIELKRPAPAELTLYVDGARAMNFANGTLPLASVLITNSAQFFVGRGPGGNYFAGDIDFLRVARGTLADAHTTIEELYDWQFGGPFLTDFRGLPPNGVRDAGPLESAYDDEKLPRIATQPTNVIVELGTVAGIRVTAFNGESFQWSKDNNILDVSTNTAVLFRPVGPTDNGVYTLCVSNAVGAVNSDPIVVTVIPEPWIGVPLVLLYAAYVGRRT